MKQGTFITFEGIDGVGKSTQLDLVYQKCLQFGHPVVKTREPGGTELGRGIRRLLLNPGLKNLGAQAELLLYAADRAQHVAEVIVPALKAGKVVLCDRYLDSTVAYQGYGLGRDPVLVRQINELAVEGVLPQLTLCLDEELERALKRTKGDRIEQRDLEYYHRVRNGYHQIARAEPERFFLIDASGTIDQVFEKIWSVIAERGIL